MKNKGFEISSNCDGGSLPQADHTNRAFRIGLDGRRGAIKPHVTVFDVDQIEHHEECIIRRKVDNIVTIIIFAPKVSDGQLSPSKRPTPQETGIFRSETFCDFFTHGQSLSRRPGAGMVVAVDAAVAGAGARSDRSSAQRMTAGTLRLAPGGVTAELADR